MDRLKDKVAIVTGGSNGIGAATAKTLAREGAKVAIVDIDDENGKKVAAEIVKDKGVSDFWHLDVSKENEVKQVFAEIYERYGKLHILVNNAGVAGGDKPPQDQTSEEYDRLWNINLKSAFFCTKYAVPCMINTGIGSIINVASIYGIIGCNTPAYDASKGAMRSMTKSDALVLGRYNIRVNSLHPGNIITSIIHHTPPPPSVQKLLGTMSVLGRMGNPEEMANCILFLASDESSYVTGTELIADGGQTYSPPPVYHTPYPVPPKY
jgi:NAD(P)-dependent dehydrogenase (short-subunit alcohol dehydrogenase family)